MPAAARKCVNARHGYRSVKSGLLSVDLDPSTTAAVALDQRVERRCVRGMQPHAAMRGWAAETAYVRRAVYCEAVIEEDRVRHRRIVVLPREPARRHHLRLEDAARRAVAAASGGDRPGVA